MFHCSSCSWESLPSANIVRCEACHNPIYIRYEEKPKRTFFQPTYLDQKLPLPLNHVNDLITLGEGNTPIVKMSRISEILQAEVIAKLEYMNPTGSFKDRGSAIMISALFGFNIKEIVEDSSGNAGASISAYGAKSGIKTHIFTPSTAPIPKLTQIQIYGAVNHSISGTRDETTEAALRYANENDMPYASHNLSPYFIEGTKTFAYEIYAQFGREIPTDIIIPVGNGSLYLGMWKGFEELVINGAITFIPKLHCVQAKAVMPIAQAKENKSWSANDSTPTRAGGIAVSSPPRLKQVLDVLTLTGGSVTTVEEDEIGESQIQLSREEGIFGEPTSAAALAGLKKLITKGIIKSDSRILIPITGFGLKDKIPLIATTDNDRMPI